MSKRCFKYILGLSALCLFSTSHSQQSHAQTSRLYLAGYMGLNMPFDQSFTDSDSNTSGEMQFKNTTSFAGALGLRLSNQFRVEAELGYKNNDVDTIDFNGASQV